MRILSIIALAAMTFGFVSCAKHNPPPAPSSYDGKTVHHHHHSN
ncbi:MAG: hypothetical protein ABI318_18290 [Chthoniobacteraceae bacterium]